MGIDAFADVVGQETAATRFKSLVKDQRLPHALLLRGPAGVGLLPFARAVAAHVLGSTSAVGNAIDLARRFEHPDQHWVFPIAGSASEGDELLPLFIELFRKNGYASGPDWLAALNAENKQAIIPVAEIRRLKQKLALKAYLNGWKVAVLWQADKLNPAASNALLKLLEEPPAQTLLLLTAENGTELLPTITSRCQLIRLEPVAQEKLAHWLEETQQALPERTAEVAVLSEGRPSNALRLLKQTEAPLGEAFQAWMRLCYGGRLAELEAYARDWAGQPREQQKAFFEYGLQVVRNATLHRYGQAELANETATAGAFSAKFSQALSPEAMALLPQMLEEALFHTQRNANPTMLLLTFSLRLHRALRSAAVAAR